MPLLLEIYQLFLQHWLLFMCCFLAAGFREAMEHARDDKFEKDFWGEWFTIHYLNTGNKSKGKAWLNKWKLDENGALIPCIKAPWYYLGLFRPEYEERFMFSSTFLVFLTDAEHLFQFFSTASVCAAIYACELQVAPALFAFAGFLFLGFIKEVFFPQVS